jgi:hypothetical protein
MLSPPTDNAAAGPMPGAMPGPDAAMAPPPMAQTPAAALSSQAMQLKAV